jgi:hypothetical protein
MCRTIYTRACIPSRHWRNKGYEGVHEMDSKLIVYTVLAITLGYLFVSAIPAQLAPSPFLSRMMSGAQARMSHQLAKRGRLDKSRMTWETLLDPSHQRQKPQQKMLVWQPVV